MTIKTTLIKTSLAAALFGLAATAQAVTTIGNVQFQTKTIPNPVSQGFNVNYRLFNTNLTRPPSSADFYLTQDDGQTGWSIGRDGVSVNCGSNGFQVLCTPSPIQGPLEVTAFSMSTEARNKLNSMCSPEEFKVIAFYNNSSALSLNTATMGTQKPSDWYISAGTMTPGATTSNGTVNVQYTVQTDCGAPNYASSGVGVYITDLNFTPLVYFGNVPLSSPTFSSHSINLGLGNILPAGDYYVVLSVDDADVISESNENNNVGGFALTILPSAAKSPELQNNSDISPRSFIERSPAGSEGFHGFDMLETTKGMTSISLEDKKALLNESQATPLNLDTK